MQNCGSRIVVALLAVMLISPALATTGPGDIPALAGRIGLSAKALAAAQMHQSALIILQRLHAAAPLRMLLEQQQATAHQMEQELVILSRQFAIEPDNETLPADFAAAAQQLASANLQITETLDALREAALTGFSPTQRTVLDRLRAASHFRAPLAFGVQQHTPSQWRQIENALRLERRAAHLGEPVPAPCAQLLDNIRSSPAVLLAQQNINTHLAATQQAFASFLSAP